MEYNEFLEEVQKKRTKKTAKINGSWGVYDAYKLIRKNGWYNIDRPLKQHEFYSIIREINNLLAEGFVNGTDIHLPHSMGKIEVRNNKRGVFLNKKGRLINTYPIDWGKTMKLWYEDKEAGRDKILIRTEVKYVPKIYYNKFCAHYKNQSFYEFAPNRFMMRAYQKNSINNKVDTLW